MDAKLTEERIKDERLEKMPFVHADYGRMPSYCILRVGRKYKNIGAIKGFIKHMIREEKTLNADPERMKNNEQVYGAKDLYADTKEYLKDCKIYTNSVIGRELLLTASPQFFKGMTKQEFNKWVDTNIEWCISEYGENFRAAYLHLDETSPHLHILIIPRLWSEKRKYFSLQNYKYFNGYKMLRDLQDRYAETLSAEFPVLQRGIKGSKAKHTSMKKLYNITNETEKDSLEILQGKAANQELLKIKLNYMDKTLKSFQFHNSKTQEQNEKLESENQKLLKEIEELKKGINSKDIKELLEKDQVQENKKTAAIHRGFSGRRYNKQI